MKAIWVDIDVGPDPKKYATLEEAVKAILTFQQWRDFHKSAPWWRLVAGSMRTGSAYKALTPTEWHGYAAGLKALLLQHGVKCDAGLTTDVARILRVPGTFNHKTNPPRPVQLFNLPLTLHDFSIALSMLPQVAPAPAPSTAPQSLFADGANMDTFKNGPAFKVEDAGLRCGHREVWRPASTPSRSLNSVASSPTR